MRLTRAADHLRLDGSVRCAAALAAVLGVVAVTSCGTPTDDPFGQAASTPPSRAASITATSGSDPSPDGGADACGDAQVMPADLADAQFAFVGRVVSAVDEIHPWTTDPENADRPEGPNTTRWVTFEVERWYSNDWGRAVSVWMPDVSASGTGVGFIESSLDT